MKRTTSIVAILSGLAFVALFCFQTRNVTGSGVGSPGSPSLPDSILKFAQKSCMACHSDDGSGMAKGRLNFDKWDSYGEKKWPGKAQSICDIITKGKMPPKGFKENNPDAVPTEKDIKMVCSWAASLQK
jgi:mono/diheme cytochrome c family protein